MPGDWHTSCMTVLVENSLKQAVDSTGSTVVTPGAAGGPVSPRPNATPDERRLRTTEMGILIKTPARRHEGSGAPVAPPEDSGDPVDALHIREVVRITGLRREQLYMWQRRYGFPEPSRDGFGDRVYPPDQVARLKLIKQLLSEGWR